MPNFKIEELFKLSKLKNNDIKHQVIYLQFSKLVSIINNITNNIDEKFLQAQKELIEFRDKAYNCLELESKKIHECSRYYYDTHNLPLKDTDIDFGDLKKYFHLSTEHTSCYFGYIAFKKVIFDYTLKAAVLRFLLKEYKNTDSIYNMIRHDHHYYQNELKLMKNFTEEACVKYTYPKGQENKYINELDNQLEKVGYDIKFSLDFIENDY